MMRSNTNGKKRKKFHRPHREEKLMSGGCSHGAERPLTGWEFKGQQQHVTRCFHTQHLHLIFTFYCQRFAQNFCYTSHFQIYKLLRRRTLHTDRNRKTPTWHKENIGWKKMLFSCKTVNNQTVFFLISATSVRSRRLVSRSPLAQAILVIIPP